MIGPRYITQKYLRRFGFETRRAKSWKGTMVHIRTENGIWRPDGHGYTNFLQEAWKLPFEDAVKQISHCGPEKRGTFILASGHPPIN